MTYRLTTADPAITVDPTNIIDGLTAAQLLTLEKARLKREVSVTP
jgi:hypothetical protein